MPKKKSVQKTSKPKLQTGISAARADVEPIEINQAPPPMKHRRQDIVGCSACGQDHTKVLFFLRDGWETKKFQYRAGCPISGKEILLKVD